MTNNVFPLIDENEDTWVIPHIGRRNVLLDFDFLPTPWFKSNVKRYTKDLLQGQRQAYRILRELLEPSDPK